MNRGRQLWQTAGLKVDGKTGEVRSINNKRQVRLSPVNLRVLKVLIGDVENPISRQQLFDTVWPNQTISDDALTRCISDLRAQLQPLTQDPLIETIPKVGYRWLQPLVTIETKTIEIKSPQSRTNLAHKVKMAVLSLLFVSVLIWALLALIYWNTKPISVPLVILPTEIHDNNQNTDNFNVGIVSNALKLAVSQHSDLQYLSQIALQSHQGSPFPYFSHQFGVRWFVESQLSKQQQGTVLTLNLVDAKTALVIYSEQTEVKTVDDIKSMSQQFINFIAEL